MNPLTPLGTNNLEMKRAVRKDSNKASSLTIEMRKEFPSVEIDKMGISQKNNRM